MSDRPLISLRPFSLRHAKSLSDGRLTPPAIPENLRHRLWSTLRAFNEPVYYSTDDNPNWVHNSTILEQAEASYSRLLGKDSYRDGFREPLDLQQVVIAGPGPDVLDLLEIVEAEQDDDHLSLYQRAINDAFTDFGCPWRLSDGAFFKIDSEFLDGEVLERTVQLLGGPQFKGASDEFHTARDKLTDGAIRDAISYASHSVESTLKAATGMATGDATQLVAQFIKDGNMDDIPADKAKAVAKALQGVVILRNELGGHGQGQNVVTPSRAYGELAVHMAGAVNQFVIEQFLRKNSPPMPQTKALQVHTKLSIPVEEMDDEIPF
ncbi:hypothetical protein FHS83_000878 [Rhizomicrobium palustre]|uniref:Abortive infection protein-like C-terminal domain-containing protein n=1 Tax=Rhizomicrobium palustre TaxID=189966 RepID=A0A846MX11_9PROT|nr:abortive infection family protein [Rhizomicrobium palustre]NIK87560.1 hypothetical protein [Rhizomicrobium palustre]